MRPLHNKAEKECFEAAAAKGWEALKRGWPDFIMFKGGRVICVEVKKLDAIDLKEEQHKVMQALARSGIECYKWTPESGLQPISVEPAQL